MPKWLFWTTCALIVAIGVAAATWFGYEGWPKNSYYAAPVIGSLLVAVGWMVTSLNTITNNEREHTLGLISARAGNLENKRRRDEIYEAFPDADSVLPLPGESAEFPDADDDIHLAVFDEINESEYIALGALKGIYDNHMLRNEVESHFLKLHKVAERYIPYIRRTYRDTEIWECFSKLCSKWQDENDKRFGKGRYRNPYSLFREAETST